MYEPIFGIDDTLRRRGVYLEVHSKSASGVSIGDVKNSVVNQPAKLCGFLSQQFKRDSISAKLT